MAVIGKVLRNASKDVPISNVLTDGASLSTLLLSKTTHLGAQNKMPCLYNSSKRKVPAIGAKLLKVSQVRLANNAENGGTTISTRK